MSRKHSKGNQIMKRLLIAGVILASICQANATTINRPVGRSKTTPASQFGKFGGDGSDGVHIVTGNESVGAVVRQYSTLTIPFRSTLTVDQKIAYIAVQGVCT